ncbi:MAG: pyruvate kinase [Lachnospiraceae bacterium]|nr:pyruvate kinase [Lachnospiraceae bacterium]
MEIKVNYDSIIWEWRIIVRKTKIVCTLGPATDNGEVLKELMKNGMNVARFNFSHGSHDDHKRRFESVVKYREELGLPIAAMLDTKGPEVRVKDFTDGKVLLENGNKFILTTREIMGNVDEASITYKGLPKDVSVGTRILIDDGLIELKVMELTDTDIICEVICGGYVSNHKGINIPNVNLDMPYISEVDRKDIEFGIKMGFDFIAASFVRCADDVLQIRKILKENNCNNISIISKIENNQGVENIDEIIKVSDGIMVARGDMGVEIPNEDVPIIQKMIIKKVYNAGKQVITATQMLDSMINNPRPTRAETADVANAIYDGTSAIMLSGETAAGKYPIDALKTMDKIARRIESDINYKQRFDILTREGEIDVTDAISHATCTTAHDLNSKTILTVTLAGRTAKMVSRYRPDSDIIACTMDEKVNRQLNLSWGVTPILINEEKDTFELFDHAIEKAKELGYLEAGDITVITAGVPLGISGTTNMLKVQVVS